MSNIRIFVVLSYLALTCGFANAQKSGAPKAPVAQPATVETSDDKKSEGHDKHKHGNKCGHKSEKHADHTDYEHDGHHHKQHGDHYDECDGPEKEAKAKS